MPAETYKKRIESILYNVGVSFVLLLSFLAPYPYRVPLVDPPAHLKVVSSLTPHDPANGKWTLVGRVLRDGHPEENARVWAIVIDTYGQKVLDAVKPTDSNGSFRIENVPPLWVNEKAAQVRMSAISTTGDRSGEENLLVPCGPRIYRIIEFPFRTWAFLPTIFFLSILVAYIGPSMRWQYGWSIALASFFTAAMIAAISAGQGYVTTKAYPDEILSLGPASMFKGAYVSGIAPEWLFSFTSPSEKTIDAECKKAFPGTAPDYKSQQTSPSTQSMRQDIELIKGFGAPLWVLFLAVLGSGILTVSMIVNDIKDPLLFDDKKKVQERMEKFVRQEFLILFAPLGAIFVYQLLVGAEAAQKHLTVALAALGAGATLSVLLDKAIQSAQDWLEAKPKSGETTRVLSALAVVPTNVTGGSASTGTVTLSAAAATGEAKVKLESSNPAVATVPPSVPVATGATTAQFTVTTAVPGTVTVSAEYGGVTKTVTLTVT